MRFFLLLTAVALLSVPASAQVTSETATYGEISLEAGFTPDPYRIDITAGGSSSVDVSSECDYGVVAEAPDLEVSFSGAAGGPLYIYAISSEDTTLLINLPDGSWVCDDDSYDDGDPIVEIYGADDGIYDIWVGTYNDETAPAALFVSEIDPR